MILSGHVAKDKSLTLDEALTVAQVFETIQTQMKSIEDTQKVNVHSVKPDRKARQPKPPQGVCWNCGKRHPRRVKCHAFGSTCDACGKKNHWSSMCLSETDRHRETGRHRQIYRHSEINRDRQTDTDR